MGVFSIYRRLFMKFNLLPIIFISMIANANNVIKLEFPVSTTIDKQHFFDSSIVITGVSGGPILDGEIDVRFGGWYSDTGPIKVEARHFDYELEKPSELIDGNERLIWSWNSDVIYVDDKGNMLTGSHNLYFNNQNANVPLIGRAKDINKVNVSIKGKINDDFSESKYIYAKANIILSAFL